MTELERALGEALREESIGPDELLYDSPRGSRRGHGRAIAAAVTALAVAAAVILGVTLTGQRSHPAPVGVMSKVIGYRWNLVELVDDQGGLDVPATVKASVQFYDNGTFGANDGVNSLGGNYVAVPGGIRASDVFSTLVGVLQQSVRSRVAADVDALFFTAGGQHATESDPIGVRVVGDVLVLRSGDTELNFSRGGPVSPPSTEPPTAGAPSS